MHTYIYTYIHTYTFVCVAKAGTPLSVNGRECLFVSIYCPTVFLHLRLYKTQDRPA